MTMEEAITRGTIGALWISILDFFMPIENFLLVISVLATINIIIGSWADNDKWRFKKAFKAIMYLLGYFALLLLSYFVGVLMNQSPTEVADFTSWITWVMIYFYVVNILRNWHYKQPDNKVIEFLYWVVSFKITDKINYLNEFFKYKKDQNQ